MNTLHNVYRNRPVVGWVIGLSVLVSVATAPASAQRRRALPDTSLAKAGSTTTVRMEEETLFADGMR
ncbi:hypothetical protein, partial [Klebsiella pneumoniae]